MVDLVEDLMEDLMEDLVDLMEDQMSRALVEVTMVDLMEDQMSRALVKVTMAELMLVARKENSMRHRFACSHSAAVPWCLHMGA